MRCRRCGAQIQEDSLYCAKCGAEIRIVPDYNPLDEVLAAQVKGAIEGSEAPLDKYEYRASGNTTRQRQATRAKAASGKTRLTSEQRRRQAERKRALKRKKRVRTLIVLGILLLLATGLGILLYQFSYTGQLRKGDRAFAEKSYQEAEDYYQRAREKNPRRAEAYEGLRDVWLAQNEQDKAEALLLEAVEAYPGEAGIYQVTFDFYLAIDQAGEIPDLLDEAEEGIAEALPEYVCDVPEFSLSDDETYDDVQQLSLESDEEAIYYTTDETDPFYSSTRQEYTGPIQISEGDTVIRAVAVNKKGVPSQDVIKSYKVELPIEDAPAVSPSTGQYDTNTEITIIVPEGYTAYYTTDETNPTEASTEYTGPVSMPEGTTIFKAVLVSANGRLSGITTRNYELVLEQ